MKRLPIVLTVLLVMPLVYSLQYYADEKIVLLDNGDAKITGTTNLDFLADLHPMNERINGISSYMTEKKGKYWLFSFNPKQNVSAVFIELELPKGATINYIKSPLSAAITSRNDIITVKFSGQNKNATISLQYIIADKDTSLPILLYWIIMITIFIAPVILVFFLVRQNQVGKGDIDMKKLDAVKLTLNETQLKIIDALLEKKGTVSQTAIQYMTSIPKSSLSRNIELLSQKEIIQKMFNGTTNHIRIHPHFKR